MKEIFSGLVVLTFFLAWIAGTVLAAGWMKIFAIFIPFYAWYLVVEMFMEKFL